MDSLLLKIAVAVAIITVITVLLVTYTKQQKKNTILLLGISDAGKTALYISLKYGHYRPTVSSMKENDGQITIGTKNYELVDMPGHERIRSRYTDFLPVTRSIVFVLDSTSLNRQIRSVAEYLYDILANSRVQKQRIPVLIACNKSDMITALPVDKIQLMLESEINRLRATRTARVEQQASEGDEEEAYLGYEGEDFKFQHLDNRVEFGQCSVEKDKLEEIKDWIVR